MNPKTVVAIVGLPTSGKTVLGRALAQRTDLHFVDIDEGPANCAPPQELNPYRSDESCARERTRMSVAYTVLHAAVEANLRAGFSLIISAAYARRTSCDFLRSAVERGGGTLRIIWCQYDDTPEEIARRVNDRVEHGAIGGCRSVEHYLNDKSRYEEVTMPYLAIMTGGDQEGLEKNLGQALAYINQDRE